MCQFIGEGTQGRGCSRKRVDRLASARGGPRGAGCLWDERHLRGARLLVRSHKRASSATACGPVGRPGGRTDGEGVC